MGRGGSAPRAGRYRLAATRVAVSICPVVFWPHLLVGVTTGTVIAFMSVTGVLLAFEPQITEWLERDRRIVAPPPGAPPLPVETLGARAPEARPAAGPP